MKLKQILLFTIAILLSSCGKSSGLNACISACEHVNTDWGSRCDLDVDCKSQCSTTIDAFGGKQCNSEQVVFFNCMASSNVKEIECDSDVLNGQLQSQCATQSANLNACVGELYEHSDTGSVPEFDADSDADDGGWGDSGDW